MVFPYLPTRISVSMVNPVCSIPKFLASRWVVILVLFQARVKHAVMQRCATQRTVVMWILRQRKLLLKAPILN